jgi:deoxyribodipyrimidine photo-lyase
MEQFLSSGIDRYAADRNHPDEGAASGLSPWLHFGHVSAHQIFEELAENEGWDRGRLATKATGAREGWWGMSANAEAFIDQLITWRELGFNMSALRSDYDRYESLPEWARNTLEAHESDPSSSSRPIPTIQSGTLPKPSFARRASSRTICECYGARRFSSGRPQPEMHWPR